MPGFEHSEFLTLQEYLNQQVIGQEGLTLRLLIALLADGHLLVEGAPGLAKTRAIKTLASGLEADFHHSGADVTGGSNPDHLGTGHACRLPEVQRT